METEEWGARARGDGAQQSEVMGSSGAMGPSLLCWVLLSWDVGEFRVLTTPRVLWGCSAAFAKSSCQVWDKLMLILGLMEEKNFGSNSILILTLIFVHQTWATYMFITWETCDPKRSS